MANLIDEISKQSIRATIDLLKVLIDELPSNDLHILGIIYSIIQLENFYKKVFPDDK